jgi:hypothetical protein
VVSSKAGVEVEAKQVDLLDLPVGSCTAVALEDGAEWETFEGWYALNEILLPASWTWDRDRQSPLGHVEPTMGGPALDRCGMVESERIGTGVENEGGELE